MSQGKIWLASAVLASIEAECELRTPLETGGVLLGYWAEGSGEPVVTQGIGPGPDAVHERYRFVPDHAYHLAEIARRYEESGRFLEYLGDWHSHPGADGDLSNRDLSTLARIASHRSARVATPVMLVMAGRAGWEPVAWSCERSADSGYWLVRRIIRPLTVKHFDDTFPLQVE